MDINPNNYDHIIVCFSGGKDSIACLLHLVELGTDMRKVELWHHCIDGDPRPANRDHLFDWPVTTDYCKQVAQAFGLPLYRSWKIGGFEGEMLRENRPTAGVAFDTPDGVVALPPSKAAKLGTRLKFPQITANLSTRWCSAYLKIDVAARALVNQKRFDGKRVLLITGERAEESSGRAKYSEFEPHRTYSARKRREVMQWRPVHKWTTAEVWGIIERHKVNPHPCYVVGFGRCSCAFCIFGNADQMRTASEILPAQWGSLVRYEQHFGHTLKRDTNLPGLIARGKGYPKELRKWQNDGSLEYFTEPVILDKWVRPTGANAELVGPC